MSRGEIEEKALPEGWHMSSLADACTVTTSPVDKKTVDGELPVKLCNYTDVYYNNSIDFRINFMTATAKPKEVEKFSIVKDDVIITKDSETPDDIGVPSHVKETINNLLCGYHLTILRPKKKISGKYVCYALTSQRVKHDFYKFANGITRFGLTNESYQKIRIPIPSFLEQKVIASLLETWDTAIEKTEALIAAKEKRFKWLLKTLISDQKNNPDWQRMKLGDLFGNQLAIEKGVMLTKAKMSKGNFPVVAGGQTYASFHNEYTHSAKTITISSSGAYAGFVGFHDYPIFATDCNVITAISGVIEYFYYAIKMQQDRIYKLQSGGAQPHVYAKDIAFLDMFIPPQKTQKQIACMLNDAQREIALHKQLVELYQRLKSGLMQKLLTGKWRVRNEK